MKRAMTSIMLVTAVLLLSGAQAQEINTNPTLTSAPKLILVQVDRNQNVETGHWSYIALSELQKLTINGSNVHVPALIGDTPEPRTRWAFAAIITRVFQKIPVPTDFYLEQITDPKMRDFFKRNKIPVAGKDVTDLRKLQFLTADNVSSTNPLVTVDVAKDILTALKREYSDELDRIGQRR